MKKVRIGVVGAGSMGRSHIAAVQATPGAEVVAICEPDAALGSRVAEAFGVPVVSRLLDDLLVPDVDAIVVASPEDVHFEASIRTLEAGKHLLVEKPLTTDVHQAHAIRDAADAAGTVVQAGFTLRYDARHRQVKEWLDRGCGGTLQSVALRRNRPQGMFSTYQRSHPAFVSSSHDIDFLLWLGGSRARRVYAVHRRRAGEANPFAIWAIVEMSDGSVATIESAWSIPDGAGVAGSDLVEVIGTKGTAHIDVEREVVSLWGQRGLVQERRRTSWGPTTYTEAVAAEILDFVNCVRANRPSSIADFSAAVHAVEVAVAMIESAEQGRPIDLASDGSKS